MAEETARLAQEIQHQYEQIQDLEMKFSQDTYVEVLEREVQKQGEVQLKKPGKFAIKYSGIRGREYLSNGKKLWIYQKGDRQVRVYPLDDERVPAEALSFLSGLGHLTRDFAAEAVSKQKWAQFKRDRGRLDWLELTPLKKRSQIQWLVMGFDPENHLAKEVYIFTESGNLSHYRFSEIRINPGLQAGLFEFREKGVKEVE